MTPFSRIATAGAAALLLTCGVVGTAASADAAPKAHGKPAVSHPAPRKLAASHPAPHKPADKLAGMRKGAHQALAACAAQTRRIAAAEAASTALSDADKATLATAGSADLAALAADDAAVTTATSAGAIRAAVAAGRGTVQGAVLQYQLVSGAAHVQAAAAELTTEAAAVDDDAAAAALDGTDVSAVDALLADLATQVGQAQTDATAATDTALAIPASPSAAQLRAAGASAHASLVSSVEALAVARQDLTAASDALAALQTPAP
ncbi:MAG TPA: hypothetical protein VFU36_01635 [Jatrophihabitans sp.]|nr:hypothetical protein [Jatrophihabitans sp.]